jgi:hypothetical protein
MIKLCSSFLFGASIAFLLSGYKTRIVLDAAIKEAYNLGVSDMTEICKSATEKLSDRN